MLPFCIVHRNTVNVDGLNAAHPVLVDVEGDDADVRAVGVDEDFLHGFTRRQ